MSQRSHRNGSHTWFRWGLFLSLVVLVWANLTLGSAWARPWSEIKESGRIRIGVKDNLPPLAFRDPQGQLIGFEIDLARELARRMLGSGEAVELISLTQQDRLIAVANGQVDLTIAQVGITSDRVRQVDFSPPYYLDGTSIVVAKASGLKTWADLRKQPIAVLDQSSSIPYLKTNLSEVELIPVGSYQAGVEQLQAGTVKGFAADLTVLTGWIREHSEYQLVLPPLSVVGLGVAMPRGGGSGELNRNVIQQIEDLKASGWLRQTAQRWGLP